MRALTALTVAMGVLIVFGSTVLVVTIVKRAREPGQGVALLLDEPPGSRIAGLAVMADRLAIELQGGGPDRVLLVDAHSGQVTGRIGLSR